MELGIRERKLNTHHNWELVRWVISLNSVLNFVQARLIEVNQKKKKQPQNPKINKETSKNQNQTKNQPTKTNNQNQQRLWSGQIPDAAYNYSHG